MEQAVEAGDLEAVKALEVEQAALAEAEDRRRGGAREPEPGLPGGRCAGGIRPAEEDAPSPSRS